MSAVKVIAEAGVNHNGEPKKAFELIDVAKEAQADYVKFQSFDPEALVTSSVSMARYQKTNTGVEQSQLEMLKKLSLSQSTQAELKKYADQVGIGFLSTPFEEQSLKFLVKELGLSEIKISSGDLTHIPLLVAAANQGVSLILSTGMANLSEIETALDAVSFGLSSADLPSQSSDFEGLFFKDSKLRAEVKKRVTLLHCISDYPAPLEQANLSCIQTLRDRFGCQVGFSDHTEGLLGSLVATSLGAKVIEKHFTLSRDLPGPDHRASLDPKQLKEFVQQIRLVERALGQGHKEPTQSEAENIPLVRKYIVAARDLAQGKVLNVDDLTFKRSGGGLEPKLLWEIVGQKSNRAYQKDEPIEW